MGLLELQPYILSQAQLYHVKSHGVMWKAPLSFFCLLTLDSRIFKI